MAEDDYAMRVVGAVQDAATQTYLALRGMKTPEAAFQEKRAAVNATIQQAFEGHRSAQSGDEVDKFQKDVLTHSAELHQLRQDHQATLDAKTKEFEHQRRLAIENFCRLLINAVGRDLFQNALRDVTNNPSGAVSSTSAPANQPTPPAEAESEIVSPAEHSVRPPPASSERTQKRKTDTEPESNRRRKRTVPNKKSRSSMWFDEVYQEGQAETKHIIVEHPKGAGLWYIIRCPDCPRDFEERPMVSAGAHIASKVHGLQPRNSENVVEKFGIRVLDCDEGLAAENNAVALQAFHKKAKGARPPADTAAEGSKQGLRGAAVIVSPTPGQIYLGYWEKAKKTWPVLLLPTANLEDVGVPETLEDLKLLQELPPCYRFNTTTKTLEWEEGFEDGGEKVAQRHFPVMFFDDGLKFPSESQASWLPAHDLEVFDIESALASEVPHIRSVREYLRAGTRIPSRQDEPSEMDLHDDAMSRSEDETHQMPEANESNSPEPTISKPWGTGVEAGPMPVVNDHETSIGDHVNSDDNLRRKSVDIISISSTPAYEWRETYPDDAAVLSYSQLNRTCSAPNADVETTISANLSANEPDHPTQANTVVEAVANAPPSVHHPSAEPAQVSELRAHYLATIAQNGLQQNLGLSDSVPPETAQQVTPREDNTPKTVSAYSDFIRMPSRGSPASHTTTISPLAENFRNPFKNQNQPHLHHGPSAPQVENRYNNSAIPPGQSQPQPQVNNNFVPVQPSLQPKVVQEHPIVQEPDPRHTGQYVPWSRQGDQGAPLHADHRGVSENNRTWLDGNEASRSVPPYQGIPPIHPPWRTVNGLR